VGRAGGTTIEGGLDVGVGGGDVVGDEGAVVEGAILLGGGYEGGGVVQFEGFEADVMAGEGEGRYGYA
jgi:hypothetical protein